MSAYDAEFERDLDTFNLNRYDLICRVLSVELLHSYYSPIRKLRRAAR